MITDVLMGQISQKYRVSLGWLGMKLEDFRNGNKQKQGQKQRAGAEGFTRTVGHEVRRFTEGSKGFWANRSYSPDFHIAKCNSPAKGKIVQVNYVTKETAVNPVQR